MNARILSALIAMLCLGTFAARNDELSVSESRIPNSPAFSLLGINPTAVEYPASPMALGVSLAGALGDGNSGSLGNVALEFSPYWWTRNSRQLSYDEYYNLAYTAPAGGAAGEYHNKSWKEQSIFKNFFQTLTLSLATAGSDTLGNTNLSKGTAVAFGFRSSLIKGRLPARALESRLKLRGIDRRISSSMTLTPDGKTEVPDSLYDELLAAEKEYAANMEYLAGFQLEIAGGGTMDLLEGGFDSAEFRRAGAWMNASYRSDRSGGLMEQFALLANARYFYTETVAGGKVSSLDLGARISWISPNEKLPLSLAAEYVRRFNSGAVKDVDRLGIVATLKLSDRYAVYLSHGANIEKGVLSQDQNLTFIGVNVLLAGAKAKRDG